MGKGLVLSPSMLYRFCLALNIGETSPSCTSRLEVHLWSEIALVERLQRWLLYQIEMTS